MKRICRSPNVIYPALKFFLVIPCFFFKATESDAVITIMGQQGINLEAKRVEET